MYNDEFRNYNPAQHDFTGFVDRLDFGFWNLRRIFGIERMSRNIEIFRISILWCKRTHRHLLKCSYVGE